MRKSILKYSLYEVKITTNNIAILRLFPSLVVKNCNNLITTFSLSTVMGLTPEGLEILFSENPEERDIAENETIEILKIGEHFVTKDAIIYAKTTISTMCGVSGDNTKEAMIEKGLNEGIKQYGEGLNLDRYAKVLEEMENGIGRDLAISLYPYTSNGVHGRYFKQGKNAKFNSPLTVFEFEEVKGDEVFLSVILGIILMQITMQFLCGDRSRKFVLIVDEAWRIIDHSVGFLE